MPTIKLVVIGASGVGKTSLRGKYISGRFSTGYRATIGADFITKTVPHPRNPDESVTLQIWDTAGQERFSSLSSAFFRGADAALLIFDVTSPDSMHALKKWWNDFRDKAPVEDEDVHEYCCVVVGNKTDTGDNRLVGESDALEFIDELVPPFSNKLSSPSPPPQHVIIPQISFPWDTPYKMPRRHSDYIAMASQVDKSPKHRRGTPLSTPSSPSYTDTMSTTHTTLTLYHTPSSSIYESARSSPEPPPSWSRSTSPRQRRLLGLSSSSSSSGGSASTSSVATITPSLFARERTSQTEALSSPHLSSAGGALRLAPEPERGPKLFFTSAKTGEGVEDVFRYVVNRVVGRWEYEEAMVRFRESSRQHANEAIQLGVGDGVGGREEDGQGWSACCA